MSNVIVLGAGMVGSAMAIDMTKNHNVTLSDLSKNGCFYTINECFLTPFRREMVEKGVEVFNYLYRQAGSQ